MTLLTAYMDWEKIILSIFPNWESTVVLTQMKLSLQETLMNQITEYIVYCSKIKNRLLLHRFYYF